MKAIYMNKTPTGFKDGKWVYTTSEWEVRVMARAEGWAMVRRKGCAPSVCREKDLRPVSEESSQ